ncbi:MAG: hypothetical protein AAFV72_00055 [Cyanobacteria bacterium J06635_1]
MSHTSIRLLVDSEVAEALHNDVGKLGRSGVVNMLLRRYYGINDRLKNIERVPLKSSYPHPEATPPRLSSGNPVV